MCVREMETEREKRQRWWGDAFPDAPFTSKSSKGGPFFFFKVVLFFFFKVVLFALLTFGG